ncbi:MAG: hypothetical protein O9301_06450 [Leptospira sp.]|nr:hypothetical protein [Leptospira sp.]
MKLNHLLPLFLITLFTFNSCETKKSEDDTTTLLGLLLLNQSGSVQTACGRLSATGSTLTPYGKTTAVKGQTVTMSMERDRGGAEGTVVIFNGVNNGDVITFATEASTFSYTTSVFVEYYPGTSCPVNRNAGSGVSSTLGLTFNSATANRLFFTASGTTPSSFSILLNIGQQSASNGRTITVNY